MISKNDNVFIFVWRFLKSKESVFFWYFSYIVYETDAFSKAIEKNEVIVYLSCMAILVILISLIHFIVSIFRENQRKFLLINLALGKAKIEIGLNEDEGNSAIEKYINGIPYSKGKRHE